MLEATQNVAITASVIYGVTLIFGFCAFLLMSGEVPFYKMRNVHSATFFAFVCSFAPTLCFIGATVPWVCVAHDSWAAAVVLTVAPAGFLFLSGVVWAHVMNSCCNDAAEYRAQPAPIWDFAPQQYWRDQDQFESQGVGPPRSTMPLPADEEHWSSADESAEFPRATLRYMRRHSEGAYAPSVAFHPYRSPAATPPPTTAPASAPPQL